MTDPGHAVQATVCWGEHPLDPLQPLSPCEDTVLPASVDIERFNFRHSYAYDGIYTVAVTVKDDSFGSGSIQTNLFVDRTPPVTRATVSQTNPAMVTLAATDAVSGVTKTRYLLDGATL